MRIPENRFELQYRAKHPIRTLFRLYHGQARNLFYALIFYCIKHSGVWALPLITASIIDIVAEPEGHALSELTFYGAFLFFIYIQNVPSAYVYMHFLSTANRNMEAHLRSALARRLQYLSMNFHFRTSTGALQTKLLRDVEMIEQLTRQLFEAVPITLITLMIALVATAIRAPIFLVFFLLIIPIMVVLIHRMRKPLAQRNRFFRQEVENMSSRLIEMIHLIPVTRAHGVERDEIQQVDEHLVTVRDKGVRLDKINTLFSAVSWVVIQLGNAFCLVMAAYLAYTQLAPISVGDVVLVSGYFIEISNSMSRILVLIPEITKGFESVYSLAEVLESPDTEQNEGKTPVGQVRGAFTLENVSFRYPETDDSSLEDISLTVTPGETLAIVGPSGAGKSTLLNLIVGFIRPTSGRILLDGIDMNTLDLRTYRQHLSLVPQNTILFRGTVRDNILYGVHDVDEAVMWQAIRDANAEDFIRDLPDGIDTLIGENGARLSGGQRQRIAIARALIRDPRVLILDEATSALDTHSEYLIQQALERLLANRTTFVVAHRLSTIRNADRIVVLDRGYIQEIGAHDDLLRADGPYARMYSVREGVN